MYIPNLILLTAAAAEEDVAKFKSISLADLIDKLANNIVDFAIHLAIAIFVFYAGKFVIRRIYSLVMAIMVRRKVDKSLSTFVLSLIRMVLYFILIVTVIGILGINTSSFIALFASAGVAIGMALSGTLQNFAGGVLILLLKPYKVGDYIEAQGYAGTVTEIQIFSTIINTYDNKSIIVPNGGLSTGSINNWSREEYRRVDWSVSISYGDNVQTARTAIIDMLMADDRIVKTTFSDDREHRAEEAAEAAEAADVAEPQPEPKRRGPIYRLFHRSHSRLKEHIEKAENEELHTPITAQQLAADRRPQVFLSKLNDSSVDLAVRAWVKSTDYWTVFYHFNEKFYNELPAHGINFPFPQLDVHLGQS